MNYSAIKLVLSLLPTGGSTSVKNSIHLRSLIYSRMCHSHVETACKFPSMREACKSFGQPTHTSHPHRVQKGEVVPGIELSELKLRRQKLIDDIMLYCSEKNIADKSLLVVIPSSQKKYMTEKIPYFFRQNSDFLYLTGCLEPDCVLVLVAEKNKSESILFVRQRDPQSELWEGPRTGVEEAVEFFGVNKAMVMLDFEVFVQGFLGRGKDCIVWYDYNNEVYTNVHRFMNQVMPQTSKIWGSPKPFIHKLRLIKSPAEQLLMKKSCEVASEAIRTTIRDSRPSDSEAFIQARVDFHCRMNGAEYLAYPPVVASGDRANIIHYINNDRLVEDGSLVLMDAGCEYHGYCSDITRTWPISGRFSCEQRCLYEVVLSVQTDLIDACSTFPTLNQLHFQMGKLLVKKLKESGIVSGKLTDEESMECASTFCPHHVSHYLGMDVHDTSSIPRHIPLRPGMVITIEPGVYVRSDNKLANPKYHGLGIRIEDDILITENGPLSLTSGCPKHPEDIEKLFLP